MVREHLHVKNHIYPASSLCLSLSVSLSLEILQRYYKFVILGT